MPKPKRTTSPARRIDSILEELKAVAGALGFQVREEKLHREVGYQVRSGACRVRDRDLLLIDRGLPPASRAEVLLDELSRHDLSGIYLSPELRRLLGQEEASDRAAG